MDMNNMISGASHFNGIPIIEDANLPEFVQTIELSHKVTVSDEFRRKTNAWYLEMFGKKRTMYMVDGKYIMHPNTLRCLRIQLDKNHA